MKIKTIDRYKHSLKGARILMRVDFNAPMENGKVKDDFKLKVCLPFIKELTKQGAILILLTHLKEPKLSKTGRMGKKSDFTTKPIALALGKLLKKKVEFLPQAVGSLALVKAVDKLTEGQAAMLENVRFYSGETKNDKAFAKQLAELADVYINDAFAVSHRRHASVSAIKKYLPCFAGALLAQEVTNLSRALKPTRPLVAVIGGAKIDSKVAVLKNLGRRADKVLIGGAVANNFLAARGFEIGRSLASRENIRLAKRIDNRRRFILPIDVITGNKQQTNLQVKKITQVKPTDIIYDIGPETMKLFARELKPAKTIVWNGPMGLFEKDRLRHGTMFVARLIASLSQGKAFGLAGGGETVEALKLSKMMSYMDWISTGGGASLAFLGGEAMPGLKKITS